MLKVLGIAVLVVLVVVAGVPIYASTKPGYLSCRADGEYRRAAGQDLPADRRSQIVDCLVAFTRKKDPERSARSAPITSGKGATYSWDGNKNVGQGSMESSMPRPARS